MKSLPAFWSAKFQKSGFQKHTVFESDSPVKVREENDLGVGLEVGECISRAHGGGVAG